MGILFLALGFMVWIVVAWHMEDPKRPRNPTPTETRGDLYRSLARLADRLGGKP